MSSEIIADNLCLRYGDKLVLENISFKVNSGDFVSIVGPSGCGKTSLLNIIANVKQPTSGSIVNKSKKISFMFQHETLLSWRTCLGNILLPIELKGEKISQKHIEKAEELLRIAGLSEYKNYYPNMLSGGMKKRIELVRALMTDANLLILDEPFSMLDSITRERLNIWLRNMLSIRKITAIMVTHSIKEACFFGNTVIVMSSNPGHISEIYNIGDKEHRDKEHRDKEYNENIQQLESSSEDVRRQTKEGIYSLSSSEQEVRRNIQENSQKISLYKQKIYASKGRSEKSKIKPLVTLLVLSELFIFLFLISIAKYLSNIPDFIYPYPHSVLRRFFTAISEEYILNDVLITAFESSLGFSIAFVITLILGVLVSKSKILSAMTMPYLIILHATPIVAVAPLLVIWFGFGYTPIIIVTVMIVFFPSLINNILAMRVASKEMETLIKFYRPRRLKSLFKLEIPYSLPIIMGGVKISITTSVIGAIVGEFVSSSEGIGARILQAQSNIDTELVFVFLIWLIILSMGYYLLAHVAERFIRKKILP